MITLLRLIENNKVDYKSLYGSWAGAFGYFQFMPSTINNYAIDYNDNKNINLKNNIDAFVCSKLFIKNWLKSNEPCFYRISLKKIYLINI